MRVAQPLRVEWPDHGIWCAESIHAAGFHMSERADPFPKLVYVLAGAVDFREAGRRASIEVRAGNLLAIAPNVTHRIDDRRPSTLLLLGLGHAFMAADPGLPALWAELAPSGARVLVLSRSVRLAVEAIWRRALLETAHPRTGSAVAVRALVAQLLVRLSRLPPHPPGGERAPQRVAAVAQEIEETFFEDWSLDRAAARAGLSRRRFSELYRARTGTTLAERLLELRLGHAARLLRAREHSALGVMFSCGFNDLSHFYRMFRRRYGAPPIAWQRQQAETRAGTHSAQRSR